MNEQSLIEEKALKQMMVGAFLLAAWGIVMASMTSSGAIMLDGMFNFLSGIMSYFFMEITRLVSGKTTRDYPLGYFAYESLLLFIKGATILVLLVMAVYYSVRMLLAGGRDPELGLMALYVVVAVIGCLVLYAISRAGFKKTGSELLQAENRAWLINAVASGAIGVALGITMLLKGTSLGWIARYVDQILVIALSLAFIKDPLVFMKNGLRELVLAAPQREFALPYEDRIIPLMEQVGARKLSLEVMKTGRRMWVTVRFTPDKDTIHLHEFAQVQKKFNKIAKEVYENTDTEVILETEGL